MPDGPHYEDDFYAWTQYQAELLRTLRTRDNRFDRANLVEEIEAVGRNERDAVRSQVRRILEHLLKLAYCSAQDARPGWMRSIMEARDELADKISPSLRRDIEETLPSLHRSARRRAASALVEHREGAAAASLPGGCPYTVEQVLAEDWYPEPPGAAD
jgi:hypothetical protein